MSPSTFRNTHADLVLPDEPGREPLAFHRRLPSYSPTPLVEAPELAARLGIGRLWVKDESNRLGLPAFKMLGASWATYRALVARLGREPKPWSSMEDLAAHVAPLRPLTLVAATDGNHGRAVARMAQLLGLGARIYVPADMVAARRQAIAGEGARVVVVEGTYDDAVARTATDADENDLVISDTAWPGYEDVPRWVTEGYSTMFHEVHDELARRDESEPSLVAVQIGVGALAAGVVSYYRRTSRATLTIVGVEPERAACVLASVEAGRPLTIAGPHDSIMAGINCGTPSLVAWPFLIGGVDMFVAVEDEWTWRAMRALAAEGISAGETGSAGLAGLLALLTGPDAPAMRSTMGISEATRALVICTEGATDPDAYLRIVGHSPHENSTTREDTGL